MLNEKLKNVLNDNLSDYNVKDLISFMEKIDIDFNMADLKGPLAMATFEGVFIDVNKLLNIRLYDSKFIYFVILHEIAHMKRIKKLGKKEILKNLSLDNFDELFNHIITEELIADKYACFIYQKLNKIKFPIDMTQQLHLDYKREKYKETAKIFFGRIKNDEEEYKKFFEGFIIKRY